MREKQRKWIWWCSLGLFLLSMIVVYMVNREIPFMMDDEWYSTVLYADTPIRNFGDIIRAQIWHYNNWGGRSIAHGLLQLILLTGEHGADILNVVAVLVLTCLLGLVSGEHKMPYLFAGMGMLFGLNANWKMSMFWEAGAANYLYMTSFLICYLYLYLCRADRPLPGITLWILPLGLAAGWSNENMGPAVWVVSTLVLLLRRREHKKSALWMYLGNIACLVGSAVMILAPGNFVRSAEAEDSRGVLWKAYLRGYAESRGALEYLFPALLVTVFVLMIYCGFQRQKLAQKDGLLLFCALLSWGAMILSPHYPDRASFGTMALLICVILSITGKILQKEEENSTLPLWAFGAAALIWLRGMYFLGEFLGLAWGWIT